MVTKRKPQAKQNTGTPAAPAEAPQPAAADAPKPKPKAKPAKPLKVAKLKAAKQPKPAKAAKPLKVAKPAKVATAKAPKAPASRVAKAAAPADSSQPLRAVPAPNEVAADEAEQVAVPRRRHASKRRRWPWIVVFSVVAVLLVVASAISWDRWLRYDDARELQGEWQIEGSARVVVIDGASIKLTDDVSYSYEIDPTAKTLSFSFGNLAGSGRYRFSADREQLVVIEGGSHTAASTLFDDLGWAWNDFVRSVQGQPPAVPQGEGVTVLVRVSHDGAAQPRTLPAAEGADAAGGAAPDDAPEGGAGDAGEGASGETPGAQGSADGAAAGGAAAAASEGAAPAPEGGTSGDADAGNADAGSAAGSGGGSPSPAPGSLFDAGDVSDA